MNIETVKISVDALVLGMVVVKLDRPWLETPFRLQGFRIASDREIQALKRYCEHVFIDVQRGIRPRDNSGERVVLNDNYEIVQAEGFIQTSASSNEKRVKASRGSIPATLPPRATEYLVEAEFEDELPVARDAVIRAKSALKTFMIKATAGELGDLDSVRAVAGLLEETVLRNPDPALLLRSLKSDEPFSFRHCVHSAVLGIALAREMGFRRQSIHELTMGILLADVGKSRLPKELLRTNRRLYPHETKIIQQHVPHGVDIARALDGLTPGTIEIIAAHHERFNGSGYPAGLAAGDIPLLARIAGLVDSFDAITTDRGYSDGIPSYDAMRELYASTVDVYQRELVEKLIQLLGAYPIGSLVELSDGAVAIVVAGNRERRLLPKVICLTDGDKRLIRPLGVLNLAATDGPGLGIKQVLEQLQYAIEQPTAAILSVVNGAV